MKLPVSDTNAPVWRDIIVKSELPSQLKPLEELAKNLWWVWNSEAKALFRDINPEAWRNTGENPVIVLQQMSFERIQELIADSNFMARLKDVYAMFKDYMKQPMRTDVRFRKLLLYGIRPVQLSKNIFRRPWCPCRRLHKRSIRQPRRHDSRRIPIPIRLFHTKSQCRRTADSQLRTPELQSAAHRAYA